MLNGALAERARLVLPGTHSKWVSVEAGRIVQCQMFTTGELFALLGNIRFSEGSLPEKFRTKRTSQALSTLPCARREIRKRALRLYCFLREPRCCLGNCINRKASIIGPAF